MLPYKKPEGPENGRKMTPELIEFRRRVGMIVKKADLPTLKYILELTKGHSKKLNYNDKRFILNFIEHGDVNKAFKVVYPDLKNVGGTKKLNRLKAKMGPDLEDKLFRKNFELTKQWVLDKMKESFEMAESSKDLTNLNRTLENFAKILKMFPTKHEVQFTTDTERLAFFRRLENRFSRN